MSNLDLRPLSIGELLDRTFSLYRRNFLLFIGIAAIPHLLVLAVKLAQVAVMPVAGKVGAPPAAELQAAARSFVAGNPIVFVVFALLGVVIYLIAILFTQGGTVFAVSELYLGRATTIGQSFSRAKGELGTLFGVCAACAWPYRQHSWRTSGHATPSSAASPSQRTTPAAPFLSISSTLLFSMPPWRYLLCPSQ